MIQGHLLYQKAKYSIEGPSKGQKKGLPLAKSGDNLSIPMNRGGNELKITKEVHKMFFKNKRRQERTWGKPFFKEYS